MVLGAGRCTAMARTHQKYYKEGYIHKEAYTENNRYNDHLLEGDFCYTAVPQTLQG